jgi:hypothetical protein
MIAGRDFLISAPIVGSKLMSAFSGPNQPPNPEQKSHPFRRKPATVPGQSGHPAFVGFRLS